MSLNRVVCDCNGQPIKWGNPLVPCGGTEDFPCCYTVPPGQVILVGTQRVTFNADCMVTSFVVLDVNGDPVPTAVLVACPPAEPIITPNQICTTMAEFPDDLQLPGDVVLVVRPTGCALVPLPTVSGLPFPGYGTPVDTGQANAPGISLLASRTDHVHRTIVKFFDEGTLAASRPGVNFVGAPVTVTDDAGNDRATVTIVAQQPFSVQANAVSLVSNPTAINFLPGFVVSPVGLVAQIGMDYGTTAVSVDASAGTPGVAPQVSRSDHRHAVLTSGPVSVGLANTAGVATTLIRSDHIHRGAVPVSLSGSAQGTEPGLNFVGPGIVVTDVPISDFVTVDLSGMVAGLTPFPGYGTPVSTGITNLPGVATTVSRSDHVHRALTFVQDNGASVAGEPILDFVGAGSIVDDPGNNRVIINFPAPYVPPTFATPVATAQANSPGVAPTLVRSDHVHRTIVQVMDEGVLVASRPTLNFVGNGVFAFDDPGNDRAVINVTLPPQTITVQNNSITVSSAATVLNFVNGLVASGGPGTVDLNADFGGVPVAVDASAGSAGASVQLSRSDHRHQVSVAAPVSTGIVNASGILNTISRSDHVHRTLINWQLSAAPVGSHPNVNVIPGTQVTLTDDVGNDRVNLDFSLITAFPGYGSPVTTGTANADGVATTVARSDHVHRALTFVQQGGAGTGARPTLNFIGAIVSAVDNPGQDRVDITFTLPVAPQTIITQNNGVTLSSTVTTLNFVSGVIASGAGAVTAINLDYGGAPANVNAGAAAAGVSSQVSRSDHKHSIDTAVPVTIAIANAAGASTSLARADHVHRGAVPVQSAGVAVGTRPTLNFIQGANVTLTVADDAGNDRVNVTIAATAFVLTTQDNAVTVGSSTTILNFNNGIIATGVVGTTTLNLDYGGAGASVSAAAAIAGVSNQVSRADHTHLVSTATAVSTAQANAAGVATTISRSDHVHRTIVLVDLAGALVGSRPAINFIQGANAVLTVADDAGNDRVNVTIAAAAGGFTLGIEDSGVPVGGASATTLNFNNGITATGGSPTKVLNLDYGGAGATISAAAAISGVSNQVSRADHTHAISTDTPVSTAQANSAGVSNNISRSDHVHRTLVEFDLASVVVASRPALNFIQGANVTLTVTDNPGADQVDVTIASAAAAAPVTQVFASSGTWTKPVGAKFVLVDVIGAGAGGSGGAGEALALARTGGNGGGGGYRARWLFNAIELGATEPITIGAGGSGSAGGTNNASVTGSPGGDSLLGAHITAFGGTGGSASGSSGDNIGGGAFGGGVSSNKGQPMAANNSANQGYGSAQVTSNLPGTASIWGGGGGGTSTTSASTGTQGGSSIYGGAGGGAGAGANSGFASTGGAGGSAVGLTGGGGTAGAIATPGGAGAAATTEKSGQGGGGGGSNNSGIGAIGGAGGAGGGGGGGGGGGIVTGGAGGTGGRGEIRMTTFF